ncbi:hypothetical protein [Nonomuraea sp. LPB2021202275-12-8]|uniref:hypothetical protein n=1 Tax=Nonomuraea sp. LPB2021202275-12-8 TaxID=3120159 RepID=UPI00300CAF9F
MPLRHALVRVLTSASMAGAVLVAMPVAPAAAQPLRAGTAGVAVKPVPPVRQPEPARIDLPTQPSPAATGSVPDRQVGPEAPEVTTPAGPALVDRIVAEASKRAGGRRPDVRTVLPDTAQAAPLKLSTPVAGLFNRLRVPANLSRLSYRLCVESADVPVSCSGGQPMAKPVAADVTGDGVADLAATVLPTARPQDSAVGLDFSVKRLPGRPALRARVWAEYGGRVSVGFDGLRAGSALSAADRGTFTVDLAGKRVRATIERTDPGASAAAVAGLTGRTMVSLRQTPATETLSVDAALDATRLDVTTSAPARLDALVVTGSRFTQAVLDRMPTRARVTLKRGGDGAAEIRFTAPSAIGRAELHDHTYGDGHLSRLASVALERVPHSFTVTYGSTGGGQRLAVDTRARRAGAARVLYFDRAAAKTVLRAELSGLPARLRLTSDLAGHRVRHSASSAVGRFAVVMQRGEGAIATPPGGHVTMIKKGPAVGVSALLSGLSGFDVTYGATPRARLKVGSSGRSFIGAASIDGVHLARLEISNTPAEVDVALDPAARRAVYTASGVIGELRAAYANTRDGPTLDATVLGVRDHVRASWTLGERSTVEITSSARLRKIQIYANRKYVTAPGGEDVQATVEGVGRRAELVADSSARTLTWTADAPVRSVTALARTGLQGREVRAAARVTGVPARFDASWNPGDYRFRGLSGPVGTAELAFTNHDGAKVPAGPHLAAHYDEASGNLDASVRIRGLSSVRFSPADRGFVADFRAARQSLALDADITRGDLRFGMLGRLGPLPGSLTVTAGESTLTYAGTRLDVRARAWAGKAGALRHMQAAPAVAGGLSLVDGGCEAGSQGCAPGPFCTPRGCFGIQGHLDVRGLPDQVTVDLARKTFTFDGFRPGSRGLGVYLASTVLAPVPIKAAARLTGLPSKITRMSLGPFDVTGGDTVQAGYRIEPAATLGTLSVHAQAGDLRGRLTVEPVPAVVAVHGTYGAKTRVRVQNSAAVDRLTAKVTMAGAGTGELRFGDVPARFGVDADATGGGLRVPAVTYKAEGGASTLDGYLGVEGGLVDPLGRLGAVSLAVTDLAADTTVRLNPDLSLDLASRPVPTGRIEVRAGLNVDPVARQRITAGQDVPYTTGFLAYRVDGAFALGTSTIDDLSLAVRGLSWLKIRPGRIPFGMKAPPALGYLTPGFEGDYARLDVGARGVRLRPDVTLAIRLSRDIGGDVFRDSVRLGPTTSLALRRYDQRMRRIGAKQQISAAGVRLACLTVSAKPGFAAKGTANSITLRGSGGPQLISLLDPGGQVPDYAVDLLTHFMSPFPHPDWKVAGVRAGGCANPA